MSSFSRINKKITINRSTIKKAFTPSCLSLNEKVQFIKDGLFHTDDLNSRELIFNNTKVVILFLNTMINDKVLQSNIIKPLIDHGSGAIEHVINTSNIKPASSLNAAIEAMTDGNCILLTEESIYSVPIPKQQASRDEPNNEKIIRGSHQGFSENITDNIQYIRERISSPKLTVKFSSIGETTKTKYAIVYISQLTNPKLIETIQNRIKYVKADSIQSPGYFEEFLEDHSFTPFPQFLNTERPDRVAANLMEGRVALVMEGSPTVLIFPITFFSFFQTTEDYNERSFIGSFIRVIRIISFLTALCLPAFYIALISFNYEVIPVEIIFSIKSSLEYVPFPPLVEAAIMQLTLELLREAAIRLPTPISQTIGVVGGLVIGTAVVEANLVSNTMLIVVAITAISSFVIPSNELSTSIRILGFPLMVFAALFGIFGIVIGLMFVLIHMSKLKSLGHPYLYPLAPLDLRAIKDTLFRVPIWLIKVRPKDLKPQYSWKTSNSKGWKKDEESN
ncbi:spore germination protein [Metabacillus indicus]|uniref:spore germination protein n=1 Tax=Metabacillus indicus TaxID=246786 RepID=UPI003CFACE22